MRVYNFGSSWRNLTKFYQQMWLIAGVIKCTLILQEVPPTKFGRVKNVQNSSRFLTTFEFDRKYLRNGSTNRKSEKYLINYISSPIGRNKFGEFWSTNNKIIDAHVDPPNSTFSEDYISAPMGRWPLKFLHLLDPGQGLLVHTTPHCEISKNSNLQQFKVIQGHRSWCQSKAHM